MSPAQRAELDALLGGFAILQDVARWAFASSPPRAIVDVVVQDEFTHDVVLPWRDGLHLVFDTT